MNRYSEIGYATSRGFSFGMLIIVVLFISSLAGMSWVSLGIVASDRWPIRWLEINGAFQRVSAEQLRATLTPQIDSSFFTIDLRQLRDSASRISWVSSVEVRKKWPDTVSVVVEEYDPVAHWNHGQLISSRGQAFTVPEADDIQGLPWLQGPDARLDEVLETWTEFNDLLLPLGLNIERLRLDRRGAWSMALANGTHIQLGRQFASERLQRLLASWSALMQEQKLPPRDIDLRYTNGFAVMWPQQMELRAGNDS